VPTSKAFPYLLINSLNQVASKNPTGAMTGGLESIFAYIVKQQNQKHIGLL